MTQQEPPKAERQRIEALVLGVLAVPPRRAPRGYIWRIDVDPSSANMRLMKLEAAVMDLSLEMKTEVLAELPTNPFPVVVVAKATGGAWVAVATVKAG